MSFLSTTAGGDGVKADATVPGRRGGDCAAYFHPTGEGRDWKGKGRGWEGKGRGRERFV